MAPTSPFHPRGNRNRLVDVAERVLNDQAILAAAEQKANAHIVVVSSDEVVHGRKVEVHLASEFRLELSHLQIDDDVAVELRVIEKQVDEEVLVADPQAILTSDESETGPKLKKELLNLLDQRPFEMSFVNDASGINEVQKVVVFE